MKLKVRYENEFQTIELDSEATKCLWVSKGDYQDIAFPISKEFREKLYSSILDTYKAEKEKPRDERAAEAKDKAQAKDDEFLEVSDKDSLPFR